MASIHRDLVRLAADQIAYAQAGEGADIVLIHGALVTLDDMTLALLPSLAGRARVTAFDRPGHGGSRTSAVTGSPWRQAEVLHAAAQRLDLHRPVLVGHSFGAAVAMAYALQFPQAVGGVVALAPIAFPEARLEHLLFAPRGLPVSGAFWRAYARAALDPVLLPVLWNAMFLPQAMPDDFADRFPFPSAGAATAMRSEGEDALWLTAGLARSLAHYARCATPVEVFSGDRDVVVNPLHARMLTALVPRGRLTNLQGLGHMLHHFAPQPVATAILRLSEAVHGCARGPVQQTWPGRAGAGHIEAE